jgi:hypothetical protein
MLGYSMDINVDGYSVILKSGVRFFLFYDILGGYYNGLYNDNNNQNRWITNRQTIRTDRYKKVISTQHWYNRRAHST